MSRDQPERAWTSKALPWILVLLVVTLWGGNWLLVSSYVEAEKRGQFGDQFGSVNALFSGLAFAGLITAILLQRRELSLQRKELEYQRQEMRESRNQLARQALIQDKSRKAAIAQLRIEVLKAQIAAIEMDSHRQVPSARREFVGQIKDVVAHMEEVIAELDSEDDTEEVSRFGSTTAKVPKG
ncbi:MAG: hypothetical protein GY719_15570 [bacterium]|nr:hypothetical protein [bacterium]